MIKHTTTSKNAPQKAHVYIHVYVALNGILVPVRTSFGP